MVERAESIEIKNRGREPLVKRVWYGMGKFVESQKPEAHAERILRIIEEKIIPRLSLEQQKRAQELMPVIETAAIAAGVVITTAEIVGTVAAVALGGQKIARLIENRRWHKLQKRLHKKWGKYKPAETIKAPVKWASEVKSSQIAKPMELFLKLNYGDPNPQFTQWLATIGKTYEGKYGIKSSSLPQLLETIRLMAEKTSVGVDHRSKRSWHAILELVKRGKRQSALQLLEQQFSQAYKEATLRQGWVGVGKGAQLKELAAKQLFSQWRNLQFPGLEALLNWVQPLPSTKWSVIRRMASKLRDKMPGDFFPWQPARGLTPAELEALLRQGFRLDAGSWRQMLEDIQAQIAHLRKKGEKGDRKSQKRAALLQSLYQRELRELAREQEGELQQRMAELGKKVDQRLKELGVPEEAAPTERIPPKLKRGPKGADLGEQAGQMFPIDPVGEALGAAFELVPYAHAESQRWFYRIFGVLGEAAKKDGKLRELLGQLREARDGGSDLLTQQRLAAQVFERTLAALPKRKRPMAGFGGIDSLAMSKAAQWVRDLSLAGLDELFK